MGPAATPNAVSPEPRRTSRALFLAATLVILLSGVWFYVRSGDTRVRLPDLADIRSVQATFFDREQLANVTFEVPSEHWDAIFSALVPARRADDAAKWPGFGRLELKLADGGSYLVSLYNPTSETGAFSAGPTFESRVYYRGGNSHDLEQALARAFSASAVNSESATE